MAKTRKITVEISDQLLKRALRQSRQGVTATVRRGLEIIAANEAYQQVMSLRGKVKFSIPLETMRKDRE